MRKYIWIMPCLIMVSITLIAILLQSCGAINVEQIKKPPTLMNVQNSIKLNTWLLVFNLTTCGCFAVFVYFKVKDVILILDKIQKSRE